MSNVPVLCITIDEELQLRLLEERYAREFFALIVCNRTYLREWMSWAANEGSIDDTRTFMKQTLLQFANNEGFHAGIWYRNSLVGSIGYPTFDWANRKAEIGYWIDASMQGRGLVTKACKTLITYAFNEYQLPKFRPN
jgi:ribosomal-protein-serine acetyltransferase